MNILCMCVCVYVCMHVCMYVCMYVYTYDIRMYERMYEHIYVCMYVCNMYICMYVCMYVCVCIMYVAFVCSRHMLITQCDFPHVYYRFNDNWYDSAFSCELCVRMCVRARVCLRVQMCTYSNVYYTCTSVYMRTHLAHMLNQHTFTMFFLDTCTPCRQLSIETRPSRTQTPSMYSVSSCR